MLKEQWAEKVVEAFQGKLDHLDVRFAPPEADRPHPFDLHLYGTFIIKDGAQTLHLDEIRDLFLVPISDAITRGLKGIDMIQAYPLPIYPKNPGVWCEPVDIPAGSATIPARLTMQYHVATSGTSVHLDLLVRHIGNFYRTIIGGPLHRAEMPFKYLPEDGKLFKYNYIAKGLDLFNDREEDDFHLPGINVDLIPEAWIHSYIVEGDYCYYQGEINEHSSR